ncbi:MAG: DUF885 family protein, partial [Candidatus Sulfotelmatobacter sp.]
MPLLARVIYLTVFAILVCGGLSTTQTVSTLEDRRKALNDLLAEQWEYKLRTSPITASFLGDKRWNDKLDDLSQEAVDQDLQETQKFLARLEAIATTGFPEQEALNKTLMVRDLKLQLEGARFKPWEMPVSQQYGIHIWLPGHRALILPEWNSGIPDSGVTRFRGRIPPQPKAELAG